MNLCPINPEIEEQMETESRARIGAGDNLATSAKDIQYIWVLTDQDFVVPSVFVSLHETEASARKWMLAAARGYLDDNEYNFGDVDDSKFRKHWENRFWMKGICAMDIQRKAVHQ